MQKSATWNGKPRTAPAAGLCRPLELLGAAVLVIITYSCMPLALILELFSSSYFLSVQQGNYFWGSCSLLVILWFVANNYRHKVRSGDPKAGLSMWAKFPTHIASREGWLWRRPALG
jgi:hypothetical protein